MDPPCRRRTTEGPGGASRRRIRPRGDTDRIDGTARTEADVARMWDDYSVTRDKELLLLHYSPLLRRVAARLGGTLPPFVERADIVSYGVFGLMDAIDKFDPDRGVRFEAYAALRIRGAIFDELRTFDWVPRSVRSRLRDVERAESALEMRLSRTPTESELAAELGISMPSLRKLSSDLVSSKLVPLDAARHRRGLENLASSVPAGLPYPDQRSDEPGQALEAAEQTVAVASAIRGLCDRDRTVIDLYYYRGLKLTEIGRVLGVTEARVSQLHTRARRALKETLLAMDA